VSAVVFRRLEKFFAQGSRRTRRVGLAEAEVSEESLMARPFKDARYPGFSSRIKNGKIVYRCRAKGMPEIRLPGNPGDPEFEVEYRKATQGQGKKAAIIDLAGRALPRTFGHAARRLETTMGWLDFDEARCAADRALSQLEG
jgi:hypothetical protein